jgi:uncharacterized protein (TIGR03437 family)
VKQLIEVQVNHPTAMRFGFQPTARPVSDETQPAGTFTVDDNIRVRCAAAGADAPCNGALEFAGHRQPTTNAGNPGPRTFIIEWTPPATDVGLIVMYAAGNNQSNNQSKCLNMVSSAPGIAPNGWISITGSKLATGSRTWTSSEIAGGKLPTSLNGTSVKINGKDAFVYSISPTQVGALAPLDDAAGDVMVQVSTNGVESASVTALLQPFSPAFFTSQDNSIVADHADFTLVGPASPARPGETVVLYGAGFGATDPAVPGGQSLAGTVALANRVKVRIGGVDVQPYFAGLSATGVYQLSVTLPNTTADGAIPVVATIGGVSTPGTATIPVQK